MPWKIKKKYVTLLEMLMVIAIIGLIATLVGNNVMASFQKGKIKQTKLAMEKVQDILEYYIVSEADLTPDLIKEMQQSPEEFLAKTNMVKNPKKLVQDAWGKKFTVKVSEIGEVTVTSDNYTKYTAPQTKSDNNSVQNQDGKAVDKASNG